MKNVYCDIDNFAIGLDQLLSDIEPEIQKEMARVVPKAARKCKERVVYNARGYNWSRKTGAAYVAGFDSKVTKKGVVTEAECGNKKFPGLVHLLEKGHNTLGGKRVAGKKHLEPAWDATKEEFFKDAIRSVDDVLKG